jgi:Ca2+-binding EF-hand superfamily protein
MPIELTQEQIDGFRDAFKKFDLNGDNSISVNELKNVLDAISLDVNEEELKNIVNK